MSINLPLLATGALSLTLALAWNDAVSKTIKSLIPIANADTAARAALLYAFVVTVLVIAVVATIDGARKAVHQRDSLAAAAPAPAPAPAPKHTTAVQLWEPRAQKPALARGAPMWAYAML